MVELNGVKLQLDINKKDFILQKMFNLQTEMTRLQGSFQGEELALKTIYAILEFFNLLYGNGTDKKITGGKTDLISCLGLLNSYMEQIIKEYQVSEKEREKLSKYNKNRLVRV